MPGLTIRTVRVPRWMPMAASPGARQSDSRFELFEGQMRIGHPPVTVAADRIDHGPFVGHAPGGVFQAIGNVDDGQGASCGGCFSMVKSTPCSYPMGWRCKKS